MKRITKIQLMRFVRTFLLVCFASIYHYSLSQTTISNKGREFWVGYGHHQFMADGSNSQEMVLYLSTDAQPAVVTVEIDSSGTAAIPSTRWRRVYNIPAYTVISTGTSSANPVSSGGTTTVAGLTGTMPKTGAYDCRLFQDEIPAGNGGAGLFRKKGIHITSDVPIVAYAHIYGSAASGATMLLPVESWGFAYVSLNSKQSYSSNCYNWTYIVAKEDNTVVEITSSVKTKYQSNTLHGGSYYTGLTAGTTRTISLMKGQIYQIIGANDGADADGWGGTLATGQNLSGTKIKSIPGPDGKCHAIAVFAGSSRTANPASCGSGGGDNDNQQLFPQQTWGKRYLTTPFSGSDVPSSFATCSYKIAVADPTTIVKRNGVTLTGIINNNYYQYESSTPDYIEANKPIMVCQFMTGGGCLGSGSLGDPEMVIISPIEQSIKRTVFYRNSVENITVGYLSLVVPTGGLPSLKIDGSSTFDYIGAHPNKTGYSIVVKRWTGTGGVGGSNRGQSIAICDSGFNGITYGLGSVESYAYNAGTNLENLSAIQGLHNQPDTSAASVVHPFNYVNTPTTIGAYIAFKPTAITWKLTAVSSSILSVVPPPLADVTQNLPTPIDSSIIGSAKYYLYTLPGTYYFNTVGTYYIPLLLTSPDPYSGGCTGQDSTQIKIEVKTRPTSIFTYSQPGQSSSCTTVPVKFVGPATTAEGYPVIKYFWNFTGNPADTSSLQSPSFLFTAAGSYPVKLTLTTVNGGIDDTTINVIVIVGTGPTSSFTSSTATVCVGQSITFTPTSSFPGTTGWWWNFGDGSTPITVSTNAAQTHTFNTAGVDTVKHVIMGASFPCPSDTAKIIITVRPVPVISSTSSDTTSTCGGNDGAIKINGLAANTTYTVYYTSGSTINTLTLTSNSSGVVTIYNLPAGNYTNISVKVGDCTSNVIASQGVYEPLLPSVPTVSSNSPICAGANLTLSANSTTSGVSYNWTGPNGFTSSVQNPQLNTVTTAVAGTYSVVVTKSNCNAPAATVAVVVNSIPSIGSTSSTNPTACATATGSISLNGLLSNTSYIVSYTVNSTNQTVTLTSNGSGTITISGLAAGTYSNITVSLNTCVSIAVGPFTLSDPNPPATPIANSNSPICAGSTLNLTANSATAGVSYEWTGPNSFTSNVQNPSITSTTSSATGTYTVVAKLAGCSSAGAQVNVVVNVIPATPTISSNSPICAGSTLNLTSNSSTAGVTYNWTGPNAFVSSDQNPSISNATTSASGNYSVTAYLNGCTSAAGTTNVIVNAVPVISSATISNTTTCATATGTINLSGLTANASYTVNYYVGTILNTITATANASGIVTIPNLTAGTYNNITVSINNCTSNIVGPFTITDPTPPATPSITSNNSPVCSGTSIVLTASSTEVNPTFSWTTPSGSTLTGQTITIPNSTSTDAGNYTVKVIVNNCTSASSAPVTVVVKPTPSISSSSSTNPTACATATGTITLGGLTAGTTYSINYKKNSIAQTSLSLTANASGAVTITNLSAGIYTNITATLNGCTSAEVGAFTLSDPNPPATPTITILPKDTVCSGTNLSLTASSTTAGVSYNWTGPNGFTSSLVTVSISNIVAANAGTYFVTATLSSCTSAAGTAKIVVNTTPAISSTSSTNPTNCNSNTGSITLNGLETSTSFKVIYTKNAGIPDTISLTSNASGVVVIPNLGAGVYTNVSVLLGNCQSNIVGAFMLTDPAAPAKPIFTTNSPICEGSTLNIAASSATVGVSYNWTGPNGFTYTTSGILPPFTNATTNLSGYYHAKVTLNSCTSEDSVLVTVNPNPVVAFDVSPFVCMPNGVVSFTNKSTIASGSMTYVWDFGDLTPTSSVTSPTHVYSSISNYTVELTVISNAGCVKSTSKPFSAFYDKPVVGFTVSPDSLCQGVTNTFVDTSSAPNSTITNRYWNFADGTGWINSTSLTQTKLYTTPKSYEVQLVVTNQQGCISDTAKKTVKVYLQPIVDAGPSFLVPVGTIIKFNPVVNDTTLIFKWSPATGLSSADSLRPTLTANSNQIYKLTATGLGNCSAYDTLFVKVLNTVRIPNAFSPNGDGINDTWEIKNLGDYNFATVEVYNRNGQIVYQSNGYNKPWDGTYMGKKIPVGVYYYIIDFKGKFGYPKLSGSITLLR